MSLLRESHPLHSRGRLWNHDRELPSERCSEGQVIHRLDQDQPQCRMARPNCCLELHRQICILHESPIQDYERDERGLEGLGGK